MAGEFEFNGIPSSLQAISNLSACGPYNTRNRSSKMSFCAMRNSGNIQDFADELQNPGWVDKYALWLNGKDGNTPKPILESSRKISADRRLLNRLSGCSKQGCDLARMRECSLDVSMSDIQ